MKLQPGLIFAGLLALGLSTYSCANGDTVSGSAGSGGDNGSGSGGNNNSGGSTGSGGSQNKGGNTGSGGSNVSSGGTTGSGGSKGGSTGSGGAKGGNTGSGGSIVSSGGTTGSGGSISTGSGGSSTTGSGGNTQVACTTSFDVNSSGFVTMPVKGGTCWSGYAYTFGDKYGTTFLPATPTSLMSMGTIVAVSGTMYSYAGLAFNLGQTNSGGTTNTAVTPTGTGLTFNYTATAPTGLPIRVQITDGTKTWCAAAVNGQSIPYSSFNTMCYDTPPDGTAYAKDPINAIQLQVAGGTAMGAYTLAITSVTEN